MRGEARLKRQWIQMALNKQKKKKIQEMVCFLASVTRMIVAYSSELNDFRNLLLMRSSTLGSSK